MNISEKLRTAGAYARFYGGKVKNNVTPLTQRTVSGAKGLREKYRTAKAYAEFYGGRVKNRAAPVVSAYKKWASEDRPVNSTRLRSRSSNYVHHGNHVHVYHRYGNNQGYSGYGYHGGNHRSYGGYGYRRYHR